MTRIIPDKLDSSLLRNIHINKNSVDAQVKLFLRASVVSKQETKALWLLRAISIVDLTTLGADDTSSNVNRLCIKAGNPLPEQFLEKINRKNINVPTAAVCVYPNRVEDAAASLARLNICKDIPINIAAVATGFPSGLYPLESKLQEIKYAIDCGATEIDVVLDRSLVLMGKWDDLFNEVKQMRSACGNIHLKVILGVGDLGSYENVYKASMVAMSAGADFIKTSTGKEAVNATLPIGLVMCRAIRKFYHMTNIKIGLKPAGGIKTAQDALDWCILVQHELGDEWLTPKLFRIGASSLLNELVQNLMDLYKGNSNGTTIPGVSIPSYKGFTFT